MKNTPNPAQVWRPGERQPPFSPEAENAVLGSILVDPSVFATALEYLKPDDFFLPAHQQIMAGLLRLFDAQAPIDVVALIETLRNAGELDAVGGPAYLTNLMSFAESSASIDHYAKIVRDKAAVRRMIVLASTVVSEGYSAEIEPDEFLDRAEARLMEASGARVTGTILSLGEVVTSAVARIEEARAAGDHRIGISTGMRNLDRIVLGMQKTDLLILAARPSMGKTSFALTLALNAASQGAKTLFVSLEMSSEQLAGRLLSAKSGLESMRMRTGELNDSNMLQLKRARAALAELPLYIDDSPRMSVLELRAKARRMRQANNLDLIMVDYLQLIDPTDSKVPREQQISEISRSLKAMAKELSIPVVALSQLSRAPEARKGDERRPILSDLRESGAIEQDADVVMFLYRPEYYSLKDKKEIKEEEKNLLEVIVAKHRNGPVGTARLTFFLKTMSILDRMEVDSDG
ncbi:MAG: replicative DNA helicase [Myxococcota bacterium]|jgi:replicative DNA helicase|nr:replicative DNA helicase [Myxococcota bacterium]HQL56365.1 replicative DNA helicase [Myxococcota bacterium]